MYFDPGTGSMLVQIVLGALPVIAAFFVGLRKKIFRKKTDETAAPTSQRKADDGFEDIDDD